MRQQKLEHNVNKLTDDEAECIPYSDNRLSTSMFYSRTCTLQYIPCPTVFPIMPAGPSDASDCEPPEHEARPTKLSPRLSWLPPE